MARVHANPQSMSPKMDSLSLRYFGLVDPTDRYLRAWKPVPSCLQFDQQRVLSHFFSLLLSPSPSSNGRLPPPSWRNEKPRLGSWKLEPNPTAIREGPTERKTALETTGSTIRRVRGIKIRCWTATCCKGSVSLELRY
jgi:hypothetical protein